jgi:hypothetical protein
VYRYYLTPPTTQSTDTIHVIDASDHDSAAYLVQRLGCERITRRVAFDVDRCHRHTGRGSAWAQPQGLVRQVDGVLAADASDIVRAAEATLDMIAFYREEDAACKDTTTGDTNRFATIVLDDSDRMTVELADVGDDGSETVVSTNTSEQAGVWAAVQRDEDLWTWAESRGLCPKCEHSSAGRYGLRDGHETYTVSGPVSQR